jgi:hypothetical protein
VDRGVGIIDVKAVPVTLQMNKPAYNEPDCIAPLAV